MLAYFENSENMTERPPVHSKRYIFVGRKVDFQNPIQHILNTASYERLLKFCYRYIFHRFQSVPESCNTII